MKEIILLMMSGGCILVTVVYGQGLSDLVGQQGKQLKILKDQIAELVVFKGLLEKGYAIAREGTGEIFVIKQGDFDMHQDHFDALKKVKKAIRDDPRVEETRDLLEDTRELVTKILAASGRQPVPDPYLASIGPPFAANLTKGCDQDEQQLGNLLADNALAMTDCERLQSLDEVVGRARTRCLLACFMNQSMQMPEKED